MSRDELFSIVLDELRKAQAEHGDNLLALAMATRQVRNRLELAFQYGGGSLADLASGLDHSDAHVRAAVLFALGALDDPQVVPFILRGMVDSEPFVRHRAAAQLRKWTARKSASAEIVPALLRALRDPDQAVRGCAAWALEVQQDLRAMEPLITALADGTTQVRLRAAEAIQRITGHRFLFGNGNAAKWRLWWVAHKTDMTEAAPL